MGKRFWKLVPKLHPDHEAQAVEVRAEQARLREELAGMGWAARAFWPPTWHRKDSITKRLERLDRWFQAALAPIGYELDPPCIGKHEGATKWFRERMAEDPDAWPFPPDEMVEEMTGQPVWELTSDPLLKQLDLGWPKAVMPIPNHPGFSFEFIRSLERDLPAEEVIATAESIEEQVQAYFDRTWPEFAAASALAAQGDPSARHTFEKLLAKETPSDKERREADVVTSRETLVAPGWLRLWGSIGYGFELGETQE